jgi:UDP-N-acetyl-D-mannosaminuronate dehydrogenase
LSMRKVVVVGMGEVGQPLLRILSRKFECVAVDVAPLELSGGCQVMHVCYPFQTRDFVATTLQYISKYSPALTIVHSTVAPGTTRRIQEQSGAAAVIYSPVRGKHARMEADMLHYKKFVAGFDTQSLRGAVEHLTQAGFKTDTFRSPEIAELSKLLETTYLGVLIGWAQEVQVLAEGVGGSFEEVNAFVKEIGFLPSHIFPGVIGGHCVMPNIAILRDHFKSDFLDAVVKLNAGKSKQDRPSLEQVTQ